MSDFDYPKARAGLRREIADAVYLAVSRGRSADSLVDVLAGLFEAALDREPTKAALLASLEELQKKADGQASYWHAKMAGMPALEDLTYEEGVFRFPPDPAPVLEERVAHGRYCEADWWQQTIRSTISKVAGNEVAVPEDTGLKDFAATVIGYTFVGSDVDGAQIQEAAMKHGLLREVVFDPEIHSDPEGACEPGDGWREFAGPLADDIRLREATTAGRAIALLAKLGVAPSMIDEIDITRWRLVPVESDFEMRQAGSRHYHIPVTEQGFHPMAERTWDEMLKVAPHPQGGTPNSVSGRRTQVSTVVTGVDYALSRFATEFPRSDVIAVLTRALHRLGEERFDSPTLGHSDYNRLGRVIMETLADFRARKSVSNHEKGAE
jgi:hypothetical protein